MTYIEFFTRNEIENLCSSFLKAPERVILIGENQKAMERYAARYETFLASKGIGTQCIGDSVDKNRIQSVVDKLSELVTTYDDCVFDLTGGEDLYLVAAGIICERFKDRHIQMHRFNIRSGRIADVDQDGQTIWETEAPALSVEDNVRLYGGDVVYEEQRKNTTYRWDMNEEFRQDIHLMWEICRGNVRLWNAQIHVLGMADSMPGSGDGLELSVSADRLQNKVEKNGGQLPKTATVLNRLLNAGLLTHYATGDNVFSVGFKNDQAKRCLTVAGQALEMKVYLAALEAKEKDGTPTYNDVMNGVYIDWDGDIHTGPDEFDTDTEIDVVMMHGMLPIFVSCKNGRVEMEELYKLNTVVERFGGTYAKKVLIATALDEEDYSQYFRQRAADMGINLIEGYERNDGTFIPFTDMDDQEIVRTIRSLWLQ